MGNNLYIPPASVIDPYDVQEKIVDGIDLRAEMYELIHTEKRGAWVIYRRVQLENGFPKKCECRKNNRSEEPDKDIACTLCGGLGYYYNDVLTKAYINHSQAYAIYEKNKPEGPSRVDYRTLYMEWDFLLNSIKDGSNIPTRYDRIIEIELDINGKIVSPTKAREVYDILSVDPYRLDNTGRIEYYRFRIISVVDKSFLV